MRKLKRLFFYLIASIYLFLILVTLAGAVAPWIEVENLPPLQLLPAVLVAGIPIYLLLFLLLRKKKGIWRFLALVGFAACLWVFSQDFNILPGKGDKAVNLKVLSYNVKNFNFDHHHVDSVYNLLAPLKADVICFQEFRNYEVEGDSVRALQYLSQKLGLPTHLHFRPDHHYQGVALLSRFPITNFDTLYMDADNANNGFLATLAHPSCGEFGIGNFHLNSFRFFPESKEKDNLWERMLHLLKVSWKTLPEQKRQIDMVLEKVNQSSIPLILTADMNALSHSNLTQPFEEKFTDAFDKQGHGIGWTFPLSDFLGVRIDYHWVSNDMKISDFRVIKKGQSDHYPILGSYNLNSNCAD